MSTLPMSKLVVPLLAFLMMVLLASRPAIAQKQVLADEELADTTAAGSRAEAASQSVDAEVTAPLDPRTLYQGDGAAAQVRAQGQFAPPSGVVVRPFVQQLIDITQRR